MGQSHRRLTSTSVCQTAHVVETPTHRAPSDQAKRETPAKLGSDVIDETIGDQEPSLPSVHGVVVPPAARWSTLVASPSPTMALETAARRIREANTAGSVGHSIGATIRVPRTRGSGLAVTEQQMRHLVALVGNMGFGDRSLRCQEVGPGHHMYDAYQHLVTPINEAACVFMEHLRIRSPLRDEPLWRYMCLCRFRDLVETEEMYFCRADRFVDEYEGLPPGLDRIVGPVGLRREFTFMNCWCQAKSELDSMWKLYGIEHGAGGAEHHNLAIQTTPDRLRSSLKGSDPIYIGRVRYFDYSQHFRHDSVGWRSLWDCELGALSLYFMKRLEHSTDKEVRAVIQYPIPEWSDPQPPETDRVRLPTDLAALIKRVIVNPSADDGFIATVKSILQAKNINVAVDRSTLANKPIIDQVRPVVVTSQVDPNDI